MFKGTNTKMENKLVSVLILTLLFSSSFFFDTAGPPQAFAEDNIFTDNIGIGNTGPIARLQIRGTGTGTGFALRIADSTPTDRLVVLDNGNVGIGTTDPKAKLHVSGGAILVDNNQAFQSKNSGNSAVQILKYTSGDHTLVGANSELDLAGSITLTPGGTEDVIINTDSDSDLNIGSGKLFVNGNTGNVGIGTASPGNYKLYVNGSAYMGGLTLANGGIQFGGDLNMQGNDIINASNIGIGTSLPGTAALAVMGGSVGIGTTDPAKSLHIATSTGNIGERISFGTTGSALDIIPTSASGTKILANYYGGVGDINFMNNNQASSILYLKESDGNVGIGSTDPSQKLEIAGNLNFTTAATISTSGSNNLTLNPGGNVVIGSSRPILVPDDGGIALQTDGTSGFMRVSGGPTGVRPSLFLSSKDRTGNYSEGPATAGSISLATPNTAKSSNVTRLILTGSIDTADFMVLNSNVGIGTASPVGLLQVGTSPGSGLLVTSNGNVGIGTTGPSTRLSIGDGTSIIHNISTTAGGATVFNDGSIDNNFRVESDGNSNMFVVDAAENVVSFGGAINDHSMVRITGTFDPGFTTGENFFSALAVDGTVVANNPSSGNRNVDVVYIAPTITGLSGSAHERFSALYVAAPTISLPGSGTLTNSATVYVAGAPTGATNNYALWVDAGTSRFDGKILGELGTAGAPQYSFQSGGTADADTGFWSPAANTVAFSTGGSERVRVDSSGNVGIGTTLPVGLLQVGTQPNSALTVLANGKIGIGTTGPVYKLQVESSDAWAAYIRQAGTGGVLIGSEAGASKIASGSGQALWFGINGAEKMRLDVNGNLGIGTDSPGNYKLYVNGSAYMGGLTLANGGIQFGGNLNMQGNDIINASNIGIGTSIPGTAALAVMGGNIGIGTTSPNNPLEIAHGLATTPAFSIWRNTATGNSLADFSTGTTKSVAWTYGHEQGAPGPAFIIAEGTDIVNPKFIIKQTSGNIGIGTTNPAAKLGFVAATNAAGGIDFGTDTNLYRSAANILTTDDQFNITYNGSWDQLVFNTSSVDTRIAKTKISGSSNWFWLDAYADSGQSATIGLFRGTVDGTPRFYILKGNNSATPGIAFYPLTGKMEIDGDTDLYRLSANMWRTGDSLVVDGNIGIGTTGPGAKLHVSNGVIATDGTYEVAAYGVGVPGGANTEAIRILHTGNAGLLDVQKTGSGTYRNLYLRTEGEPRIAIESSSGNVGVGITGPLAKLDIRGPSHSTLGGRMLVDDDGNYNPRIRFYRWTGAGTDYDGYRITDKTISGLGNGLIFSRHSSALLGSESVTDVMILDDLGNVGIGTTNPTYKLYVNGSAYMGGLTLANGGIQFGGNLDMQNNLITNIGNANTNFTSGGGLNIAGNVGIGTVNPVSAKLVVQGSATSGVDFISTAMNSAGEHLATVFDEDNNVWIFRASGAGRPITFSMVGTEVMRIKTDGNVGIGTTSPTKLLQVNGDTLLEGHLFLDDNKKLFTGAQDSSPFFMTSTTFGTNGATLLYMGYDSKALILGGDATQNYDHGAQTNPTLFIQSATSPDTDNTQWISFAHDTNDGVITTGKGDIVLSPASNVGIATTAPVALLQVSSTANQDLFSVEDAGTGDATPFVVNAAGNVGIGTTNPGARLVITNTTATPILKIYDGASNFEVFTILDDGYVGIGTTSPRAVLEVGKNDTQVIFSDSNLQNRFIAFDVRDDAPFITVDDGDALIFGQKSLADDTSLVYEWMRFVDGGNVGIGTTNPGNYKLYVNGNAYMGGLTLANGGIEFGGDVLADSADTRDLGSTSKEWRSLYLGDVGKIYFGLNQDTNLYRSTANTLKTDDTFTAASGIGWGTAGATLGIDQGASMEFRGTGLLYMDWSNDGAIDFDVRLQLNGDDSFSIQGGNVGINELSPGSLLSVKGGLSVGETIDYSQKAAPTGGMIVKGNVGIGTTGSYGLLQVGSSSPSIPGLIVLANNNVGIGTTSPDTQLQVRGDGIKLGPWYGREEYLKMTTGDNFSTIAHYEDTSDANSGYGGLRFMMNAHVAGTPSWGGFRFQDDDGVIFMQIVNTGNVGIGTTGPGAKLHVSGGTVLLDNNQPLQWKNTTGTATTILNYDGDNYIRFGQNVSTNIIYNINLGNTMDANNQLITRIGNANTNFTSGGGLNIAGNVGIGTTSPGGRFHIKINSDGALPSNLSSDYSHFIYQNNPGIAYDLYSHMIAGTNGIAGMMFGDADSGYSGGIQYYNNGDSMRFQTAGSEQVRITNNGNVGIGTTDPTYKLYVNGSAYMGGLTLANGGLYFGGDLNMQGNDIINASNIGIGTSIPGTAALAVMGGNAGIGTTSPGEKLEVNGNLKFSGAATISTASGDLTLNPTGNIVAAAYKAIKATTFSSRAREYDFIDFEGGGANVNTWRTQNTAGNAAQTRLNIPSGADVVAVGWQNVDTMSFDRATTISTTAGALTLQPVSGNNLNVTLGTTGDFAVNTNQLYVDTSAGNVGIGTTNPGAKLNVSGGDMLLDNALNLSWKDGSLNKRDIMWLRSDNSFRFVNPAGSIEIQTSTAQNVGFWGGSAGTGRVLSIDGTQTNADGAINDSPTLRLAAQYDSDATVGINMLGRSADIIHDMIAGDTVPRSILRFSVGGSLNVLNIYDNNGTGSVGIGTTNPGDTLDVVGTVGIGTISLVSSSAVITGVNEIEVAAVSAENDPGYTFVGDADTGMYAPTANVLGFSAGGTEKVRIDSSGNVGIGTTNPTYKLYVNGSAYMGGLTLANGGIGFGGDLNMQGNDIINASNIGIGTSIPGTAALAVMGGSVGIGTTSPSYTLDVNGVTYLRSALLFADGGVNIYTPNDNQTAYFDFLTDDEAAVRANDAVLRVWGDGTGGSNFISMSHTGASGYGEISTGVGNLMLNAAGLIDIVDTVHAPIYKDRDDTNYYLDPANTGTSAVFAGSVGIGTVAPGALLHLQQNAAGATPAIIFDDNGGDTDFWMARNGSNDGVSNDYFQIGSGTTEGAGILFTIDSSGNAGIGTTSPGTKLHVAIDDANTNNIQAVAQFYHTTTGTPANGIGTMIALGTENTAGAARAGQMQYSLTTATAASETGLWEFRAHDNSAYDTRLAIRGSSVGIGTTAPGNTLEVNGNIAALYGGKKIGFRYSSGDSNLYSYMSANGASPLNFYSNWGGTATVQKFTFNTDSGQIVTILDGGNVGIGTTNPTYKLYVNGNAYMGGLTLANGGIQFGGNLDMQNNLITNIGNADTDFTSGGGLNISGNVGIGTTGPNAALDVRSNTVAFGATSDGTIGKQQRFTSDGSNASLRIVSPAGVMIQSGATPTKFSVSNAITLESGSLAGLTSNGNVGIGTTNPSALLSVGSTSQFQVSTAGAVTAVGVNAGSGLIQGTGGLTLTGATLINNSGSADTTIGNSAGGTITIGASSGSNLVLNDANWSITGAGAANFASIGATTAGAGTFTNLTTANIVIDVNSQEINTRTSTNALYIQNRNDSGNLYLNQTSGSVLVGGGYGSTGVTISGTGNIQANGTLTVDSASTLTGNVGIGTASPVGLLQVGTSPTAGLVVTSAGNVGIGTSSPTLGKLQIVPASSTDENAIVVQQSDVQKGVTIGIGAGGDAGVIRLLDNTETVKVFLTGSGNSWFNTGNVGIGTNSPNAKLEAYKAGSAANDRVELARFTRPAYGGDTFGGGPYISLQNYDVVVGGMQGLREVNSWNGALAFYTHTNASGNTWDTTITEKMRIKSDGNVGIGTTNPTYKLYVNGNAYMGGLTLANGGIGFGGDLNMQGNDIINASNIGIGTSIPGTAALAVMGGNVGIGTTDPAEKLAVNGNLKLTPDSSYIAMDDTSYIYFGDTNWQVGKDGGGNMRLRGYIANNGDKVGLQDATGNTYFLYGTKTAGTLEAHSAFPFFADASDTALTVPNGNVGIGDTAPSQKLTIRSTNNADIGFGLSDVHTTIEAWRMYTHYNTVSWTNNYLGFSSYDGSNDQDRMVITGGGNVGIGTTGPSQKLHVSGGDVIVDSGKGFMAKNSVGSEGYLIYRGPGDSISIGHPGWDGNTVFRLNGNVGIGTTDPTQKLQIGNPNVGSGFVGMHIVTGEGGVYLGTDDNKTFFDAGRNGVYDLTLDSNGNLGIGTTGPSQKLEVNGDLNFSTSAVIRRAGSSRFGMWASRTGICDNVGTEIIALNTGNVGIGTTGPYGRLDIDNRLAFHTVSRTMPTTVGNYVELGQITFNGAGTAILTVGFDGVSGNSLTKAYIVNLYWNTGGWRDVLPVSAMTSSSDFELEISTTNNVSTLRVRRNVGTQAGTLRATIEMGTNLQAVFTELSGTGTSAANPIYNYQYLKHTFGGNVGIGTPTPVGLLQVGTSPTAGLVVTSAGNVGIGTTNPTYKLYVNGSAYMGGLTLANGGIQFGGDLNMQGNDIINVSNIGIGVSSPGTAALAVIGGNVGIGTTGPSEPLAVGDNGATAGKADVLIDGKFADTAYTTHGRIMFNDKNFGIGAGGFAATGNDDDLYLWAFNGVGRDIRFMETSDGDTNPSTWTTNMIIKNGGNVGIGTTGPLSTLEVAASKTIDFNLSPVSDLKLGNALTGNNQHINNIAHMGLANQAAQPNDIILYGDETFTNSGQSQLYGSYLYVRGANTSAASSQFFTGHHGGAWLAGTNTQNLTNAVGLRGIDGLVGIIAGATGTVTGAASLYAEAAVNAATLTNWYGVYVSSPSGAGTVTNKYAFVSEANAGNVGIGNTSPAMGLHIGTAASGHTLTASNDVLVSGKLELDGYAYFDSNIYIADGMNIKMGSNSPLGTSNADNYYFPFQARDTGVGMVEVGRVSGAADPYFSFGGSQQFKFYNSGTANFGGATYFTSGNVGIGTTNPGNYKLYVNGSAYMGGLTVANGTLSFSGDLNMNSKRVYNIGTANSGFDATGNLSIGTNPAQSGIARIPNAQWLVARNAANSADINMWQVNSSNETVAGNNIDLAEKQVASRGTGAAATNFLFGRTAASAGETWSVQTYNNTDSATQRFGMTGGVSTSNVYFLNSNVGIGTTSPEANLHIKALPSSMGVLTLESTYAGTTTPISLFGDNPGGDMSLVIQKGAGYRPAGYLNLLTIDMNGNTSSTGNLRANGSIVAAYNGAYWFKIQSNGSASSDLWSDAGQALNIKVNGAASPVTAMSILSGGNVGIGTTAPYQRLDIRNGALLVGTESDTTGTLASLYFRTVSDPYATMRYTKGAIFFEKTASYGKGSLHLAVDTVNDENNVALSDTKLTIDNTGNVGIGTTSPTALLQVSSTANQDLFSVEDAGTGDTTQFVVSASGNVGIAITNPQARLAIGNPTAQAIVRMYDGANFEVFTIKDDGYVGIGGMTSPTSMLEIKGKGAATNILFRTLDSNKVDKVAILDNGNVGIGTTSPGTKFEIRLGATNDDGLRILSDNGNMIGQLTTVGASGARKGQLYLANEGSTKIVLDANTNGTSYFDSGGNVGIGTASPVGLMQVGTSPTAGLVVTSAGSVGIGITSPGSYKLYVNGTSYFNGQLTVTNLNKLAGSFMIDHPLDPANKVLRHSFTESPDMKNFYDGVAVLDEKGECAVNLPDYFESLNKDFRYQLTPVGKPAMLYIKEEVKDNKFVIAGGEPGMKVNWQVTGIRQDAYANKHRIVVEEEKGRDGLIKGGEYLCPDCFTKLESESAPKAN